MSLFTGLWAFLSDPVNWSGSYGIPHRVLEHAEYTALALVIALFIAVPIGLYIGHTGRGAFLAINIGNAARAIPTVGLLTIIVLLVGIGLTSVLVALVVIAIPPLLTSTDAGVRAVDRGAVDAARGMGMREREVLAKVELPLALPLMIAGMRSAGLQVVATATIAAYVALGGLGRFVIDGLAVRDYNQLLAGAVLVAVMAIVLDLVLVAAERLVVSPGVSGRLPDRPAAVIASTPAAVTE